MSRTLADGRWVESRVESSRSITGKVWKSGKVWNRGKGKVWNLGRVRELTQGKVHNGQTQLFVIISNVVGPKAVGQLTAAPAMKAAEATAVRKVNRILREVFE